MDKDEQAIRGVVAEWMRATQAGDVDAVLDLMTEDVVFLVPGRPAPMGKAEFAALARQQRGGPPIEGHSEIEELKLCGDWAFAWARLHVRMGAMERRGHTLSVFQRGADGRWRLARDANLLGPAG